MNPHKRPLRCRLEDTWSGMGLRDYSGYTSHFKKDVLMCSRDEDTNDSMKNSSILNSRSSALSTIFHCLKPKFSNLVLRFSRKSPLPF